MSRFVKRQYGSKAVSGIAAKNSLVMLILNVRDIGTLSAEALSATYRVPMREIEKMLSDEKAKREGAL